MLSADRGFYGVDLWCRAAATGADLLWRVRKDLVLPVVDQLPDGFCLTEIFDRSDIHHTRRGVPVRAVEYTVAGHEGVYRLITTILDPYKAPAGHVGPIRIALTAHRTVVLVDRVDQDGSPQKSHGRVPSPADR
ncbi:hypothetical protein OH786_33385 [Streptomyces atratus]|uniref:Transposase DDE domain-containing protein n=1 Tax=Streptomyces atratus TaxID=1893 RepID=A0A1K2EES0_STRAR|nr:hypothetical protein [Streptomyces atratus]SFY33400.1 hypothetical protein SAMN02787144_1018146 [Streptomyces atratus]